MEESRKRKRMKWDFATWPRRGMSPVKSFHFGIVLHEAPEDRRRNFSRRIPEPIPEFEISPLDFRRQIVSTRLRRKNWEVEKNFNVIVCGRGSRGPLFLRSARY